MTDVGALASVTLAVAHSKLPESQMILLWYTVSHIMVMSPQVSWLFFKARAKRPYLSHTGRASNAEKQPTGRGPEGCVENGPAAALLVGYVQHQFDGSPRKPIR